ncbi:hypothetical protein EMCRGX_G024246 [Ephydatia muelleri]
MSQALQGMRQMQAELKVMHQGQEETTQLSSTQAHKESVTFKKDECQCKASQQVTDRLAVVVSCLDCVEVANAAGREWPRRKWYRKGMSFLACRQKGTELADHSEVGALGPYSPINLSLSPNTDVHVFSSGVGPLLSNLEDPELRRLSKSLPATVLRSRKDWTTKTYLGAFQRWKT